MNILNVQKETNVTEASNQAKPALHLVRGVFKTGIKGLVDHIAKPMSRDLWWAYNISRLPPGEIVTAWVDLDIMEDVT